MDSRGPFPAHVTDALESYYRSGMDGWSGDKGVLFREAVGSIPLNETQLKDWIKRRNLKRKNAESNLATQRPLKKKARLWHQHLKTFAQSKAGKEALEDNPGRFNKEASESYKKLTERERESLLAQISEPVPMTKREVCREGAKIFETIQKSFNKLEELGFVGFAIGFYEEKTQIVGTSTTLKCFTPQQAPQIIEYLHAIIVAANPPDLTLSSGRTSCGTSKTNDSFSSKATLDSFKDSNASSSTSKTSRDSSENSNASSSTSKTSRDSSKNSNASSSTSKISRDSSTSKTSHDSSEHSNAASSTSKTSHDSSENSSSTSKTSRDASENSNASSSTSKTSHDSSENSNASSSTSKTSRDSSKNSNASSSPRAILKPSDTSISETNTEATHSASTSTSASVSQIVVSSSPVKNDQNDWIPALDLHINDRAILESSLWLNDAIIFAAQALLKKQSKGEILGWKSTQCSKMEKFPPLPNCSCKFVQVLNVANSHWIVASNINVRAQSHYSNSVCIYDSGFYPVSLSVKRDICQFWKPKPDAIFFDLMNIQTQPNANDCGVFAIACATELVHGCDPVLCNWEILKMRQHLLISLEKGYLDRFPCTKKRRVPFGSRVRKSVKEVLYCSCRMPNDKSKAMICCDQCQKWFHKQCEGLDPKESYKSMKWLCCSCKSLITYLGKDV